MCTVADHRHETFGRKRGERKFFRGIDGTRRRNIPGAATSGEFDEERGVRGKTKEFGRNRSARGDEGVVVSAEIEGQGLGMERLSEMVVEEGGEFVAIGDRAGFVGKILKDQARIVGGAKEGAVDALRAAFHDRSRDPNESDAEEGAESHPELRVIGKETGEETGEEKDGNDRAKEKKEVVAALNKNVASATADKSGDFEDAVFHDGVSEGKRIEEEDENRKRIVKPHGRLVAK